jgi:hypothetical protein
VFQIAKLSRLLGEELGRNATSKPQVEAELKLVPHLSQNPQLNPKPTTTAPLKHGRLGKVKQILAASNKLGSDKNSSNSNFERLLPLPLPHACAHLRPGVVVGFDNSPWQRGGDHTA